MGSGSSPYTQDSSPVIIVFIKSGSLFLESSMNIITLLRCGLIAKLHLI
jgi:hypothetical protein